MVGVHADVLQVVVFAAGTNALLRVGCPNQWGERRAGLDRALEDGLEPIPTLRDDG